MEDVGGVRCCWWACHLTVHHDELALSVKNLKEAQEIQEIMETAVELKVPSPVDIALGPNWGTLKKA